MSQSMQSALIVPVPEAEPVVGRFRATLDSAAAKGVPAHVTVLYPFLPPAEITEDVLATLRQLFAGHDPFEARFAGVDWFDDVVTWLAPEPKTAFQRLTAAVWERFPQAPPYGGEHEEVRPHLTVGHDHAFAVLHRAATEVATGLPISAQVRSVHLMTGSDAPNSWQTLQVFTLGNGD